MMAQAPTAAARMTNKRLEHMLLLIYHTQTAILVLAITIAIAIAIAIAISEHGKSALKLIERMEIMELYRAI